MAQNKSNENAKLNIDKSRRIFENVKETPTLNLAFFFFAV